MAISLKKYDRQVGVSAQTGTQAIGGGLASAMIQEAGMQDQLIGDAIGALGDVAVDFFEHKAKGEVAKYEAYKEEWANELEVKKQQGLLDGGLSATDLYDKVVVPEQMAFEKWVSDQGFSSLARQKIDPDVVNFGKKVNVSERLGLIQRQTEENNYNLQQSAQNKEIRARQLMRNLSGIDVKDYTFEQLSDAANAEELLKEADGIYEDLKRTTKAGVVEGLKSTSLYNYYTIEISELDGLRATKEISGEEYLKRLEAIRSEATELGVGTDEEPAKLQSQQFQQIDNITTAKINNFKGEEVKTKVEAGQQVFVDLATDSLSASDLRKLDIEDPELANSIRISLDAPLRNAAVNDANARKFVEYLEDFKSGKISYTEAIRNVTKIKSSYAVAALSLVHNYAIDAVNSSDSISAYEVMYDDKKIDVDSNTKDFIGQLATFAQQRKADGLADFVNEKAKAFNKWRNTQGEKPSYEEFRKSQFSELATNIITGLNPPQITTMPIMEVNTVERVTNDGRTAIFNSETKEFIRYK
jgi:hypothetical protein